MQFASSVHAYSTPCASEHSHAGSSWPRFRPMRAVWYMHSGISSNVLSAAALASGRWPISCGPLRAGFSSEDARDDASLMVITY